MSQSKGPISLYPPVDFSLKRNECVLGQSYEELLEGWPTAGAKAIFIALYQAAIIEERENLTAALDNFQLTVINNRKELFLQHRGLQLTYLDAVLYIPLLKNGNKNLAIEISEALYKFLLEQTQQALSSEQFNAILDNANRFNFRLLQRSITSLSFINVQKTLALLSAPGREKILYSNLTNLTADRYSTLQQAILSGNREIINLIFTFFSKESHRQALEHNLQSCSNTGFMCLLTAIKSGTEEDIDKIIALIKKTNNNAILVKNLENRNRHGFMILQAAIRANSFPKLLKVISLFINNASSLVENLKNRTEDGFMTITCAVAFEKAVILDRIIDLFVETKNEAILKDNLKNQTKDKRNVLQIALKTKSERVLTTLIALLSKKGYEQELKLNLTSRCQQGFMVLQEALKTTESRLTEIILDTLVKNPSALKANLGNVTTANYTCLIDAVKSGTLADVEKVIALSERHLEKETWKRLLVVETGSYANTALHVAVNRGNQEMVTAVLNAIQKAFGNESTPILREMVKDLTKFYHNERTHQTLPLLAEYLPLPLAEILPTIPTRENKDGLLVRLCAQTCHAATEHEFDDLFRTLQKMVTRYSEQLGDVSENGWNHLSKTLLLPGKRDANKLFANKKSKILFSFFFKQMQQKLPLPEFKKILSMKTIPHHVSLMHHVIHHDHDGEITDILIRQYSEEGFEDLLREELSSRTDTGLMLTSSAISSRCLSNIDKILSLLTRSKFKSQLRNHLVNITEEGYCILQDAVRRESFEVVKKIADCLVNFGEREVLALNLANHTHVGFSLLHDALMSGVDDISILIINLSEQYLDLTIWKKILSEKNPRGYNCLQNASNKGTETTIKLLIEAIIRAFGQDAENVIDNMLSENRNWQNHRLNRKEVINIFSSYFVEEQEEPVQIEALDLEEGEVRNEPKAKKRKIRNLFPIDTFSLPEQESDPRPKSLVPCGGISDKYLSLEGPLPTLPEPEYQGEEDSRPIKHIHTHALVYLHSLLPTSIQMPRRVLKIQSPTFDADYHTYRSSPKDKMLTFVIAGRKMQALLPRPQLGRCVLVLTQNEFEEISPKLPKAYDALVIKKLNSVTHGNFENILGLPAPRRLAVLLFSEVLKLPSFMMIDDNISQVNFNASTNGWDGFYQFLRNQLENLLCVSVRTDSYKVSREAELGSKCFMVNLQALREKMGGFVNFFALFPKASEAHKCLEDYHMQLMFYALQKTVSQGYQIIDKNLTCLVRAKKYTHAFARTGTLVQLFEGLAEAELQKLPRNVRQAVKETNMLLNGIIDENIQKYLDRKRYIENADLQLKHARANKVNYQNAPALSFSLRGSFMERFQQLSHRIQYLPGALRDYQKAAIDCFAESHLQNVSIILPTSAGKTIMQCQIAIMARASLKKGEHIIIVTPHISLVKQFYLDFVEYNKTSKANGIDLRIPQESIITVSSHRQCCHIKTLMMNKRMQNQNCILIFCAKSFDNFFKESKYQLPKIPLILADEYHYYPSILRKLVSKVEDPKPRIIGCTATPPINDPLAKLYQYQRAEGVEKGFIASVIADSVGVNYSKQNVLDLIYCFPKMLSQYSPGFEGKETLREGQGIFFLPSIAHCEMAYHFLRTKGVRCYSIHSKNKRQRKELAQFVNSDEPGVLLAVKLCLVGLNIKKLSYIVIGQNANPDKPNQVSKIEQMIGRVMRVQKDKIGYILCFKNVLEQIIKPSISQQVITQPLSIDYLQQDNVYYTHNGKSWKVCENYSKAFIKDVFLRSMRYHAKFRIVPTKVTHFSPNMPQSAALKENVVAKHQHVIALSEESNFTLTALSKALREDNNSGEVFNLSSWEEEFQQFLIQAIDSSNQKTSLCQITELILEEGLFKIR